jgi:hypothetical protein
MINKTPQSGEASFTSVGSAGSYPGGKGNPDLTAAKKVANVAAKAGNGPSTGSGKKIAPMGDCGTHCGNS